MASIFLAILMLVSCAKPRELKDYYASDFKEHGCDLKIAYEKVKEVTPKAPRTVFDSGDNSELITCLPSTYPHGYIMQPLYAVKFVDLKRGDVVQAFVEAEFTNDYETDFMVSMDVRLSTHMRGYDGYAVTEANGYNITPGNHHGVMMKHGVFLVPEDMPEAFLIVNAWAADGRYLTPSKLKVEQDYGKLSGLILRNEDL